MASSSLKGSTLPIDIIELILTKVPIKSLFRFKLTCKPWFELLKEKQFIYNKFDIDMVHEHFIRITNLVEIINPTTKAQSCLPRPDEFQHITDKLYHVIHCDGLLLCSFRFSKFESKLAVWNPCFEQVRWITKPSNFNSAYDFYGFGYENVSRDNYKILRFHYEHFEVGNKVLYNPGVEIYEFKSDSWRILDVSLDWIPYYMYPTCVSLKGNMYWVGDIADNSHIYIQSFDFSTEDFKLVCVIPFKHFFGDIYEDDVRENHNTIALSAFRGDKLSLLHQIQDREIEVWVTNSVKDKVVKLTKLFALSRPDLPRLKLIIRDRPLRLLYFIDENNEINVVCHEHIDTHTKKCICINLYIIGNDKIEIKEIKRQSVGTKWKYTYFPSLVPAPKEQDMQ